MARQAIIPQTLNGPYPTTGVNVAWTAAQSANKQQVALSRPLLLLVRNTNTNTNFNVTINSVSDSHNRTGTITNYSVPFGSTAICQFYFRNGDGWKQTDGNLYFEAEDDAIEFAALYL